MTKQALFVDLSNFYSRLLKSGLGDERVLRDYFLDWLDFDRLALALTGDFSTVWIFYSGTKFGPSSNRVDGDYLKKYITRINSLRGVTARDVNIPGEQREPITSKCDGCGKENLAEWTSEKGIDSSLAVHLFDTMDSWDVAYLLSGDADFVPAVSSLRRRGKIVIGAGFSDASSALIRECYDFIDLSKQFLKEDLAAYEIFRKDGIIQKWFTDEVKIQSFNASDGPFPNPITLTAQWQIESITPNDSVNSGNKDFKDGDWDSIRLIAEVNTINLESRQKLVDDFKGKYPQNIAVSGYTDVLYCFAINRMASLGVGRRLEKIGSYLGCKIEDKRPDHVSFSMRYIYDDTTKKYEVSKFL